MGSRSVTAILAAVLKILRLIALYSFCVLIVVPSMVKEFTTMIKGMFDEMAKGPQAGQNLPGPADFERFGSMLGAMGTTYAMGMIILGVIYPVIVTIALTRPRVKAACAGRTTEWD